MLQRTAELQPLFLGLVLAWAGGYKLTAHAARGLRRSTLARLVGPHRVGAAYRVVGSAELTVAALLLMPPPTAAAGWLAVAMTAGFVAYLGYARVAAPDTSCGCLSAKAGPVTGQAIGRAGLLLVAALVATAADTFWLRAVVAQPAWAAIVLGIEFGLFLALSPELNRPARRTAGWVRRRLFRHRIATATAAPLAVALSRLHHSTIYCANASLLRSDVQDTWRSAGWQLVSYAGRVDGRPVTVVFAVPDGDTLDQVRMSIVDDAGQVSPVSAWKEQTPVRLDALGSPGPQPSDEDGGRDTVSRRLLLRGGLLGGALGVAAAAQLWRPTLAYAVAQPTIYSTGDWGAEPARGTVQILDPRPTKIIVHHTATANSSDLSRAHAFQLARNIQQAHFARGFIDTGQHFTISRGGYIMAGRHHSRTELVQGTDHVLGAHCTGQNEVSVGIENEGTYITAQIRDAHYTKLVRLCAYICQQCSIAPGRIFGHRDFVATECPGDRLYARLPRLRDDVRALL